MSSFYKMDPAAWDFGTADLTLEQEAAYLRIINAIHKHDQTVPNNDRVLAGLFRCSTRKARALIEALIAAGKIHVEDGKISNDRAISDLVHRGFVSISRAESGAKGGRTRAENAAKALKTNNEVQANASSRIEKNRIEGGGGNAHEREPDRHPAEHPHRERILSAMGVSPDGVIGPSKFIGTQADMAEVGRWLALPGITIEAVEVEIANITRRKRDGPPSRFSYFTPAMQRLSASLTAPQLEPTKGSAHDQQSARDRRSTAADDAFVRVINAAAGSGRPS